MKRNGTLCWSKMADSVVVSDYFFNENGILGPLTDLDDRFLCAPSDDIWKKFELLPTPPRSPSRNDDEYLVPEPKLNLVSDLLDSPDLAVWGSSFSAPVGLKNDLLHDCMWSGQCRETCKRVPVVCNHPDVQCVKSEPVDVDDVVETNCDDVKPSPTLFVDPCTMLPYTPLSDHSYHSQQEEQSPRSPPFCDTPSDTEDDEIDVVTLPASVGFKVIKTEPIELRGSFQPSSRSLLNRSAPHSRSSSPKVPPLKVVIPSSYIHSKGSKERKGRKRQQKRHHATTPAPTSRRKGRRKGHHLTITPPSSDCEQSGGGGRRSMHNTMERDRRLALKSAFTRLRANVPALEKCSKTPKVMILNSAAAYLKELAQKDIELEKKKEKELRRRADLQRRLNQLRSMN